MQIEKIKNNPNFGIKVDKKLIKDANRFYSSRMLPIQSNKFNKTVELLDLYGSDDSVILHHQAKVKNQTMHMLCLKNEKLNNKKALIMTQASKYNEILKYFNNLTGEIIEAMEKMF